MITVFMSANKLNNIQLCAYKAHLEGDLGITPIDKSESLEKGDILHRMLEHYYREKLQGTFQLEKTVEEAVEIARRATAQELALEVVPAEETVRVFKEYSRVYLYDRWVPLAVEAPFSKVLYERPDVPCVVHKSSLGGETWEEGCSDCKKLEGLRIVFEGKIDLVVRTPEASPNDVMAVDHKSMQRDTKTSDLSNQLIAYPWAIGRNNIIVNKLGFQKSLKVHERFTRTMLSYLDDRIEEWIDNTIFWTREWLFYQEIGQYKMNWTSCDKWGGCIFRHVCRVDRGAARDWKIKSGYKERESHDIFKGSDALKGVVDGEE